MFVHLLAAVRVVVIENGFGAEGFDELCGGIVSVSGKADVSCQDM